MIYTLTLFAIFSSTLYHAPRWSIFAFQELELQQAADPDPSEFPHV